MQGGPPRPAEEQGSVRATAAHLGQKADAHAGLDHSHLRDPLQILSGARFPAPEGASRHDALKGLSRASFAHRESVPFPAFDRLCGVAERLGSEVVADLHLVAGTDRLQIVPVGPR